MRRRRHEAELGLSPECVWLFLVGWGVPLPPDLAALPKGDVWQCFADDLGALWRQHRAELMAEARRRGIEQPWGLKFDEAGDGR